MEFRILGPLEVRADGRAVALAGAKPRALLAVLVLHANQPVSAERLALALWGEDAPAGAVKTVQVHVSRLRKALGDPDVLATTPAGYRLRVRPGELDAERFERLVADGRRALAAGAAERAVAVLYDALELWRGPPLAELASLPFAPAEIERLEERHLAAVEARVEADLAAGRHGELVAELQQLTSRHPWRERLHAQLMLALYRSGRQADALHAYRRARGILVEELGIEPGAQLRDLQQAILAHDLGLDAPRVIAAAAVEKLGALPVPATALFGRGADLDRLERMVHDESRRLVTLVGPGGAGKTRLAIEAARRLGADFRDGAGFVALAPVSDNRELASAIARALAAPVREGEPPASALLRFLGDRQQLLLVDNLEHLLDGAPLIGELLAACPELTILVTSREPTRLAAERLYPVRRLEVPATSASAAELERYSSVAMFLDRARARDPDFGVDAGNARHVCEICRRLDGLPLALELAAAWVGLLSPAELASRLDRALTLLVRGPRDAPPRQRTLRATIDWSHGLLTGEERGAFARLAVFAGGATVTAAEVVTGASLDTLESLVAKHLLVHRDDRLLMLDTVRQYALERLARDPDRDPLHERLLAWSRDFTRKATPHLRQAGRNAWLARLDAEYPNALAALAWALENGRAELALELVGELGDYWWQTNRSEDGLRWIDATVEQARDGSPGSRAKALLYRARLIGTQRHDEQRKDLQASLALFRACDDAGGIATCLGSLALSETWNGRFEQARTLGDEAVHFAKRSRDEGAIAFALAQRAITAEGFEDAADHARDGVAYLRRVGNLLELAWMCNITGYLAIAEGRYRDALPWLDEGLEAARRLGHVKLVFYLHSNQGLARLFLDQLEEAAQAHNNAIAACHEAGAENIAAMTFLAVAAVAARRGDFDGAARLAGAARRHRGGGGSVEEVAIWSRVDDEILTPARARFGHEDWDRAEREGAGLTVYEAIELALVGGRSARAAPRATTQPLARST
jgi:predicted ATPase/DNA-binding SARP family transcriptional activator